MLIDAFQSPESMILFLLALPTILISLSMHEWAHANAAYRLGDPTARNLGRLSFDPLKHLDPIGTLCMMICGFGWAKPVPVNTRNFKKPFRGMALTSLAGPLMNLFLCFLGCFMTQVLISVFSSAVYWFQGSLMVNTTALSSFWYYTLLFFYTFASLNAALAVFNLLPFPPLDGSRLLWLILPPKWTYRLVRYERYFHIALLILLFVGFRFGFVEFVTSWILKAFFTVIGWLPFL